MPRTYIEKINIILASCPDEVCITSQNSLYCISCQKQVNFTTIAKVKEHCKSKNHTIKLQKIIDAQETKPSYLF